MEKLSLVNFVALLLKKKVYYDSSAINHKSSWQQQVKGDDFQNVKKEWTTWAQNHHKQNVREHVLGLSHTVAIECVMVMICLIVWWRNENLSVRSYEVWQRALHSLVLTNLLLWVIWCWYPGGFDSLTTLPLDTTSYSFFITFLLVWKTWFSTLIVNTWTLLILLILKWNYGVAFFFLKGKLRDKKKERIVEASGELIKVILSGQRGTLSFELPCFLWEKGPHFSLTFLHEKHFFSCICIWTYF